MWHSTHSCFNSTFLLWCCAVTSVSVHCDTPTQHSKSRQYGERQHLTIWWCWFSQPRSARVVSKYPCLHLFTAIFFFCDRTCDSKIIMFNEISVTSHPVSISQLHRVAYRIGSSNIFHNFKDIDDISAYVQIYCSWALSRWERVLLKYTAGISIAGPPCAQ